MNHLLRCISVSSATQSRHSGNPAPQQSTHSLSGGVQPKQTKWQTELSS